MTPTSVASSLRIKTPSRLHFGLFGFGHAGLQYGGVGAMVERPGLSVRIAPADHFTADGPLSPRVAEFARRWARFHRLERLPAVSIQVEDAPRQHVGLGVGTQLGLAVAAGLSRMAWGRQPSAVQLARSVRRGLRSAVGIHGFERGGLIVEEGKRESDEVSPLGERVAIPTPWRFVLVRPDRPAGLSGTAEQRAFADLPPVSEKTTRNLRKLAFQRIVPALRAGDFDAFSQSVFRFGLVAGHCFAAAQGGAYNGRDLTALVRLIRDLGIRGVGQTSWGPTLFCILPDRLAADRFCVELLDATSQRGMTAPIALQVTRPDNTGARIS